MELIFIRVHRVQSYELFMGVNPGGTSGDTFPSLIAKISSGSDAQRGYYSIHSIKHHNTHNALYNSAKTVIFGYIYRYT